MILKKKEYKKLLDFFLEGLRKPIKDLDRIHLLDFGYSINDDCSIEIFEIRPRFDKPEIKLEIPVAKTKYIKKQKVWKIYWQRGDLKWQIYEPVPEVSILQEFIRVVVEDEYNFF